MSAPTQIDRTSMDCLLPSKRRRNGALRAFALGAVACMIAYTSAAQTTAGPVEIAAGSLSMLHPAHADLSAPEIDAPQPQPSVLDLSVDSISSSSETVPTDQPGGYQVAPLHRKFIMPDMRAQTITARDKVIIGLKGTYSPMNFSGIIFAAAYEQLRNGQPNYGTDSGAFGQRLGAAGIRGTTQGVFTDSVFAPLLHEDPRYYVEGKQYGVMHRAIYALTRPVVTRTDSGRRTINGP